MFEEQLSSALINPTLADTHLISLFKGTCTGLTTWGTERHIYCIKISYILKKKADGTTISLSRLAVRCCKHAKEGKIFCPRSQL